MLEVMTEKREPAGAAAASWSGMRVTAGARKVLSFEMVPNRITTTSATFSIYRAKVPGGWLVMSRPSDNLAFVPDPEHLWDGGSVTDTPAPTPVASVPRPQLSE
jgi:hypothetical protein